MGDRSIEELMTTLKCANIVLGFTYEDNDESLGDKLRIGFTREDLEKFLSQIDFDYDSGYGGQELYGTAWWLDGSWWTRGEYDGSEWWERHYLPIVPKELR